MQDTAVFLRSLSDSTLLTFCDSVRRTYLRAAAAADACVGIDVIDLALADCLYWAYGLTCTARYAVVTNYISHNAINF